MLFVVDGLQLMWLAWNSHKQAVADGKTALYENFLEDYTRTVLAYPLETSDKIVVVWDNFALKNVKGYEEIKISLGRKGVQYTKQIIARLDIIQHFVSDFFYFIQKEIRAVQLWSIKNTADDVMYMYIRNIQKNTDPPPSIMFLPNSKSLFGLVDRATKVYIPAVNVNGHNFESHILTNGVFEDIIGCVPSIFMLRRALRGDYEEDISPVPGISVQEADAIEHLAVQSAVHEEINFFIADDACRWFSEKLTAVTHGTIVDAVVHLRNNYFRMVFLPVSQLYVQRPEPEKDIS